MKRFFKIAISILLIIFAILTGLYFYVINNAKSLIKEYVAKQSNGKLAVDMDKVVLNTSTLRIEVFQPHLYSTDSVTVASSYDIRVKKITLDLADLKPLIFKKKILIDSVICMRPQINISKWKEQQSEHFSLPAQMGKAYNELNGILKNLNVKYCLIDSGSFTLINKLDKNSKPVTITDYYLRIDNLSKEADTKTGERYLFTDRIKFYSSHQDILAPDGKHGLKYSRLRINSQLRSIEMDSCYLYGNRDGAGFNEFNIFFDTLRLTQVDFNKMTLFKLFKADSAICINPEINIRSIINKKQNQAYEVRRIFPKDSLQAAVKSLFGNIDIGYVGVRDAVISLQTKLEEKISSYKTRRIDFWLKDIRIIDEPAVPVSIGGLYLGLKGYEEYNSDSNYVIRFDSIVFNNSLLTLTNLTVLPTERNRHVQGNREIRMPSFQLSGISWYELVVNRRLIAQTAIMFQPKILVHASPSKTKVAKTTDQMVDGIHRVSEKLYISKLRIIDGSVDFFTRNNKELTLDAVNADIGVGAFLQADNLIGWVQSVDSLSFANGNFISGINVLNLDHGRILGKQQSILVKKASLSGKGKIKASFEYLQAIKLSQSEENQYAIENLTWNKAVLNYDQTKNSIQPKIDKEQPVKAPAQLMVGTLSGKQTSISFRGADLTAGIHIRELKANDIFWKGKGIPSFNGFYAIGDQLYLKSPKQNLQVKQFRLADKTNSTFSDVRLFKPALNDSLTVYIPELKFVPDFSAMLEKDIRINDMVISNPVIHLPQADTSHTVAVKKAANLPKLNINNIEIVNPDFGTLPGNAGKIANFSNHQSKWQLKGIHMHENDLTVEGVAVQLNQFQIQTKGLAVDVSEGGNAHFKLSKIKYTLPGEGNAGNLSATVDDLDIKEVDLTTGKKDSFQNRIKVNSLVLKNLNLIKGQKLSPEELLKQNTALEISKGYFTITNPKSVSRINGLSYHNSNKQLIFDSLSHHPAIDRDSFNRAEQYQKDYISVKTGKAVVSGIDPNSFSKEGMVHIRNVSVSEANLQIYKDKRLPFKEGIIKLLPTAMLQQVKKKIQVDSLALKDAYISYEEMNDKTLKTGLVFFHHTDALVRGIKTSGYNGNDSLRLSASSWFLDSAYLKMRFNQSYADSLHGFLFSLRMKSFHMPSLNPVLVPLASAKILEGQLDTLSMNAIGREFVSHGKMKMYYRDLKIQYLDKGEERKKTLKAKLISFLANSLILKHNNRKSFGEVYVERLRERSVFNYWVKMILSGVVSSTGVKSNNKQSKKYRKSIRKLMVPEIPETTL